MTPFQDKIIRFIGKSENPSANEILLHLLTHVDSEFRKVAFQAIYLKKSPELYVLFFKRFMQDEEYWGNPGTIPAERLAKIVDAALRDASGQYRQAAAEAAMKYKLYEILPTVVLFLESQDQQHVALMRKVLLHLADSFFDDIMNAPPEERRNFDRKREWFVSQLDSPIKRYSVNACDEAIQSLLIIGKKDFDLMKLIAGDSRSAAGKKFAEYLRTGTHRSFLRVLLNYVDDPDSPGTIDEIISERSDALFVRKLLEYVGLDPSSEFRSAVKRFKEFVWFRAGNPELPALVAGLERNAVQLLQSVSFPKERMLPLYRFFLERESVDSRRAAAESVRWLVGEEINHLLLEFVNNSDPQTAAILFRLLKSREASGIEDVLPVLIERTDSEIRQAIYDMMPDLHVETFASRVGQMTPMTAQKFGRYVRLIDSSTFKKIDDDIKSPIPIRRAAACRVAMYTDYAKEFLPRIIEIATIDDEMSVRLPAIAALSTVLVKDALATLKNLENDRSTDIRDAVRIAVQNWAAAYHAITAELRPAAPK